MLCSYLLRGWAHIHVWLLCSSSRSACVPTEQWALKFLSGGPHFRSVSAHHGSSEPTAPLLSRLSDHPRQQTSAANSLLTYSTFSSLFAEAKTHLSPYSCTLPLSGEFLFFSSCPLQREPSRSLGLLILLQHALEGKSNVCQHVLAFRETWAPLIHLILFPLRQAEEWIQPCFAEFRRHLLHSERDEGHSGSCVEFRLALEQTGTFTWVRDPYVFFIRDKDGASLEGFPDHSLSAVEREEEQNPSANGNLQGFLLLSNPAFFFKCMVSKNWAHNSSGLSETDIFTVNKGSGEDWDGRGWQPCFYLNGFVTWDYVLSAHHFFIVLQELQHNFWATCMESDLGAAEESNCRYIFRTRVEFTSAPWWIYTHNSWYHKGHLQYINNRIFKIKMGLMYACVVHKFPNNMASFLWSVKIWSWWSPQLHHWSIPQLWKGKEIKNHTAIRSWKMILFYYIIKRLHWAINHHLIGQIWILTFPVL